jgi:CRP-like cAMP-binding protein
MSAPADWPANRLLIALPNEDFDALAPELERQPCPRELILTDADAELDEIYFPDHGVISAVAVYADGGIIETATIGREGCTAVQATLGARNSSLRLVVQVPGHATKMSRKTFDRAMQTMPAFRDLMRAYVQAFLEQVLVSVACNGSHSVRQRLARWLLMMRDRSDDDTLRITQDFLAEMLGVQRPSVTVAAQALEAAGVIQRGRREVRILDRVGLIRESCECYQLTKARVASYLPKTYP